ncbi:MAG: hypothetical protein ACLPYY_17600 [Acidimicrobiales bacterium]
MLAAAVAAGLYGIDHELELADPFGGNAYEAEDLARIPSTLVEALRELELSEVATAQMVSGAHAATGVVRCVRSSGPAPSPRRGGCSPTTPAPPS